MANQSISRRNFYAWCDMFLITKSAWSMFRLREDGSSTGQAIRRSRYPLARGNYVVLDSSAYYIYPRQRSGASLVTALGGQPIRVHITSEDAPQRVLSTGGSSRKKDAKVKPQLPALLLLYGLYH
jgi:hypothetical protein